MKLSPALFCFLLGSAATAGAAASAPAPARALTDAMSSALEYRAQLALAVAKNQEAADAALLRLSAHRDASGFVLASADADLGYAALDVGRRLISLKRPDAAEVFFRAAEQALAQAARQAATPEQAHDKAQYLQKLATVRATYLNQAVQAKADIDEAIRLQPEDKSLVEARQRLARGRPEAFKETARQGDAR